MTNWPERSGEYRTTKEVANRAVVGYAEDGMHLFPDPHPPWGPAFGSIAEQPVSLPPVSESCGFVRRCTKHLLVHGGAILGLPPHLSTYQNRRRQVTCSITTDK